MCDLTGKIVKDGEERNELLSGMRQDIRQQTDDQKKMHLDDETAKCLRDFDAVDLQNEMADIEARKDMLLKEAYEWVLRTEQYAAWTNWDVQDPCRLLWINGPAGMGKTMLLIGIIRELEKQPGANLAYFFCQSASQNLKDATSALRCLIWLLLQRQPQLTSHILAKYESGSRFNDGQAFWTPKRVFLEMLADQSLSPVYLIVDALDDCDVEIPGREQLIELISESLRATDKVRWLFSSRPGVRVYEKLKERDTPGNSRELDVRSEDAVNAYIDHHLRKLAKKPGYTPKIQEEISREVRQRAMNTFLWVALVFKELQDTPGLGQDEDPMHCQSVLAAVCLAYRPLAFDELPITAGLDRDDTPGQIVKECGSFLTVQEKTDSLVYLSAREWLMSNFESRLQKRGAAQVHADIWRRSIAGMSAEESGLKRNICSVEEGTQSEDIVIPNPDPLAALRYSCEFWIDHLFEDRGRGRLKGFSIGNVDFSPNGKFLAALSSREILLLNTATGFHQILWDTATGTWTQAPKLEGEVTKWSFSEDGKFLLTNLGRLSLDDGSVSPQPPTERLASDEGLASPLVPPDRMALERPAIDGLRYDGEWVSREGKNLLYIPAG